MKKIEDRQSVREDLIELCWRQDYKENYTTTALIFPEKEMVVDSHNPFSMRQGMSSHLEIFDINT